MSTTAKSKTKVLVEAALLVSLATVLSLFKIADLPYGGSVTLASMFPVLLLSYRRGIGWGLSGGVVFALLQQLLGLSNLSYFSTWQSVLAVFLLDYLLAFCVVGIGGVFRRVIRSQSLALCAGAFLVCTLRYACHVLAGATVWAGLSIPQGAALLYSLGYNATYMIPETIVLLAVCYYLGALIDFRREMPVRLQKEQESPKTGLLSALAGLIAIAAVTVDSILVFTAVQDPESGAFDITRLFSEQGCRNVLLPVSIVTACAAILVAVILVIKRRKK